MPVGITGLTVSHSNAAEKFAEWAYPGDQASVELLPDLQAMENGVISVRNRFE